MNLKPWALSAYEKSLKYSNTSPVNNVNGTDADTAKSSSRGGNINRYKSIFFKIQASLLWMSYIIYRGYRGFFVILPAVFREVYRQLEESQVVVDVYGDDEGEEEKLGISNAEQQQQEPMKLRTRITISILSGLLTASYVVSGAFRVLGTFIKTFTNTTSVESSFEAAADEVVSNEDKLRNKMK